MLLRPARPPQVRAERRVRTRYIGGAVSPATHLTAIGVPTTVLGMVPDLPAQLARMDQRFDGLDVRLDLVDARLDGIDRRLDHLSESMESQAVETRRLSERIESQAVETRRHFDVVAESL